MLLTEFQERTGFNPTPDCYTYCIEPEYNRSNLDKDAWCKQWKRNGGLQRAYDWQCNEGAKSATKAACLENELDTAKASYNELFDESKKMKEAQVLLRQSNDDLQKSNIELTNDKLNLVIFLIEQAEKWSASDLREKAIEIVGAKKYLSYKISHNMNLWDADKELLIENLK